MSFLAAAAPYTPMALAGVETVKALRERPKKQPVIPMPDEEAIRTNKRRTGQRRTGRASTILTETDGLGG